MDEQQYAWGFAVTRNKLLDWRPMLAPEFMIAQGGEYFLVHAADPEDGPDPSRVVERIVTSERYGDLTLVVRNIEATADLIGGSPREQLLDRTGRPIQMIEGLVLRGRHPGSAARWEDQLTRVDVMARRAFPRFWESEDEAEPPVPSQPLTRSEPGAQIESSDGEPGPRPATVSKRRAARRSKARGSSTVSPLIKRATIIGMIFIAGLVLLYFVIQAARG